MEVLRVIECVETSLETGDVKSLYHRDNVFPDKVEKRLVTVRHFCADVDARFLE